MLLSLSPLACKDDDKGSHESGGSSERFQEAVRTTRLACGCQGSFSFSCSVFSQSAADALDACGDSIDAMPCEEYGMAFAGGAKPGACSAVTCDLSTIAAGCGGVTKPPSMNDRDASPGSSDAGHSDAGRSNAGKDASDDEDASTEPDDDAGAR
jgi:hypothetical protein